MKKLLTLLAFTFILSFQSFGQQTLCEIYGSTPIFETFDLPVNASSLDFSSFEENTSS